MTAGVRAQARHTVHCPSLSSSWVRITPEWQAALLHALLTSASSTACLRTSLPVLRLRSSLLNMLHSLQQACVISPIWTAPECDEHSTEPVHWSRDGKSGLVLIRGRGDYNHVVSLGLGHLALGQVGQHREH